MYDQFASQEKSQFGNALKCSQINQNMQWMQVHFQ